MFHIPGASNDEWPLCDWRPITARVRGREVLSTGVKDLKDHLSVALRIIAMGEHRVVVHSRSQLLAALVPIPDYWFVTQVDDALRRYNWRPEHPWMNPDLLIDHLFSVCPPPTHPAGRPRPIPPPARLVDLLDYYRIFEPALVREALRTRHLMSRYQAVGEG